MIDYREDNQWTVYVHIVPKELSGYKNDKYYVGITSVGVKNRWHGGSNYKGQIFYNAIKKYGWNNIKHEIIAEHLTKDEACNFEKTLISLLNSTHREYGYNAHIGGEGGNRKELKAIRQYTTDGVFIKEFISSAEAGREIGCERTNITHACKNHSQSHGYLWRYSDEEPPQRYRKKRQKSVIQKDLDGNLIKEYWTLSEAAKETGIGRDNILRCIKGKNRHASGYLWFYK